MNNDQPTTPAPAAAPSTPGKRGGGSRLLLVLVLAAVAGGGVVVWRVQVEAQARLNALQATLDSVQDAQAQARTQLSTSLSATESAVQGSRAGEAALAGRLAALDARIDTLATRLAAVPEADANALQRLATAEVTALVALAEQRLLLARDVAGASAALNLARTRVADATSPLAVAIARDLATLASFHDADLVGMAAEAGQLANASRQWPLAAPAAINANPEATGESAAEGGWRGFIAAVGKDLRALVEIRDATHAPDPLLDPMNTTLARQRFAYALEAARLALLVRDTSARDAALAAASSALGSGFDTHNAEVRQAATRLAALVTIELAPTLPVLGSPETITGERSP